jgi:hypothetical protein
MRQGFRRLRPRAGCRKNPAMRDSIIRVAALAIVLGACGGSERTTDAPTWVAPPPAAMAEPARPVERYPEPREWAGTRVFKECGPRPVDGAIPCWEYRVIIELAGSRSLSGTVEFDGFQRKHDATVVAEPKGDHLIVKFNSWKSPPEPRSISMSPGDEVLTLHRIEHRECVTFSKLESSLKTEELCN